MGTPEFAVPSLEILIENKFNVVAVVTAPDKPSGRGLKLTPSPVKLVALEHEIPVLQPEKLKSPGFLEELASYKADLQIVVAFRMLPEAVWNMPSLGTFNLHASLLPDYRGAAPINWAIMNDEKETGVTTFFLNHEIDTGDIILQEKTPIDPDENVESLYRRLMSIGAGLVLKTTRNIQEGTVVAFKQHIDQRCKPAPKIFKEDCEIDYSRTSREVKNFVRGLSPYPAAWTMLGDKQFKILSVEIDVGADREKVQANEFFSTNNKDYLLLHTGDGAVSVKELQMEGKKRMKIEDFFRGNKL